MEPYFTELNYIVHFERSKTVKSELHSARRPHSITNMKYIIGYLSDDETVRRMYL